MKVNRPTGVLVIKTCSAAIGAQVPRVFLLSFAHLCRVGETASQGEVLLAGRGGWRLRVLQVPCNNLNKLLKK